MYFRFLMATLPFPVVDHCRKSQSPGSTLFGLAMVENPGLAVGISTLSVVVPVVSLFPVLVAISLFPVIVRCYSDLLTLSASSPWSKNSGLPAEWYWYLSYCRRYKYFRFGWPPCYFRLSMSHLYTVFHKKTVPFVISLYLFFYKDKFHENPPEVLVIMSIK